jgi:hypothetical protein
MTSQSAGKKHKAVRARLTWKERVRLELETDSTQKTIGKWMAGLPVRESTRRRLEKACAELGFEVLA